MRAAGLLTLAALAASAAAEQQYGNVVTETVIVTKTVDVTVTLSPGETPPPSYNGGDDHQAKANGVHHGHKAHHGHGHGHKHHAPPPHKPKYHAPPPAHKPKPKPVHQKPPPPPPSPYTPPAPAYTPSPKPKKPKVPAHGAPIGTAKMGDMTHYSPGLGSCGITSTADEDIVALAVDVMNNGANPNANPLCGQYITIDYQGRRRKAKIVDTCQACASGDIDCSPSLFVDVAPSGDGRVPGVKWYLPSA